MYNNILLLYVHRKMVSLVETRKYPNAAKSLIRSKLDYCCPVWSPIRKADICSLEAIQRSFTARIITLKGLTYWERLRSMKLMSVQRRRERYIVLHMWKIYCGIVPNDVGLEFYSNDKAIPVDELDLNLVHTTNDEDNGDDVDDVDDDNDEDDEDEDVENEDVEE